MGIWQPAKVNAQQEQIIKFLLALKVSLNPKGMWKKIGFNFYCRLFSNILLVYYPALQYPDTLKNDFVLDRLLYTVIFKKYIH